MTSQEGRQARHRPVWVNPFIGAANPASGITAVPSRRRLPGGPTAPATVSRLIRDELMLDGNPRLNLATFVSTWMEPEAHALMGDIADRNLVDRDEYPATAELEQRCIPMLRHLWNAPDPDASLGTSTVGSSEACMLGGMALKRRWSQRNADRYAAGARPNLVMGVNTQVCWKKFCNYWEVEPRLVPMEGDRFHLGAEEAAERCDENTIGVVAVLGSTMDGSYEPVADICAALDVLEERTGWSVPVHVDAASGGMIAPFLEPDLVWDFRLPRVASINVSGHKYGMVYPGLGWVLWRDRDALPGDLVEHVDYLGGDVATFTLNFSRSGSQVVAQYYNFLRLGYEGFREVQGALRQVATHLAGQIEGLGCFRLLTRGDELPVFAFTTADDVTRFNVYDVSRRLREWGWLVPAYAFPPNREDLRVLRVVCRNGFSLDLADRLADDLRGLLPWLHRQSAPMFGPDDATSFHH
ncbi:glutamate decarboxylase [Microbispora catharanthi]|uniref:Glutamate decarboxylase n=1 Tax=Microbispora catharanthi TaxID=1712871 RepID=A0A5N6BWQ3_9ACTN|nr:glutamate decarboxylase [Microbispora catharanthi]KAB8184934.1 glutamate decarboxylase [Microbispora catharanthi]